MVEDEQPELLFFDTFSHDINEELNLDLVQFPKPVYITEVRIIPLGARVQADFPGGVRLGATNPSQFHVDFFVNDLGRPGASTFENLGSFEYNQNDCIHLECLEASDENLRQIPTDGLVLRGWYTTITLAVYGTFTKVITEQIASPPASTPIAPPPVVNVPLLDIPVDDENWDNDLAPVVPIDPFVSAATVVYAEPFEKRDEYFNSSVDVPKDPRISDWALRQDPGSGNDNTMDRVDNDWDRTERHSRRKSHSSDRPLSREISRTREKSLVYSRSPSRDKEYTTRSKREWSRSPEYRSHRKVRESSYEISRNYEKHRSSDSDEPRKRPRTPPIVTSPRRPRTPEMRLNCDASDEDLRYRTKIDKVSKHHDKTQQIRIIDHTTENRKISSPVTVNDHVQSPTPQDDDVASSPIEQFEPILSDEEIGDEADSQFDIEYDFSEYDDISKIFNPFEEELKKFELENNNPTIQLINLNKHFDNALILIQKFNSRSDKFNYSEFLSLAPDGKECWVHFTEQFIQTMNQFNHDSIVRDENYKLINAMIKDEEVATILFDWIKIGLNFEYSISQPQPGYKIRHIKAGIRLVEVLLCYDSVANFILIENKFDVFTQLLVMYDQKFMALSIKLMIIKAIHSSINSIISIEYFIADDSIDNGYRNVLKKLEENPLTRIKFSLKALVKKINLYESLKFIKDIVSSQILRSDKCDAKMIDTELIILKSCLIEVHAALSYDEISYSQPKRFLPVSAKFDCIKDLSSNKAVFTGLVTYFKTHAFLESLLMIFTNQNSNFSTKNIIGIVYDILREFLNNMHGIDYLIHNIDTTNLLLKVLLGSDKIDDSGVDGTNSIEIGCEMAFKIQLKYHLDAIINYKNETDKLIDHLHLLYCLTCNSLGKQYVVETLCMDSNISPILNLIEIERKSSADILPHPHPRQNNATGAKLKSPVLNYSVDIIDCVVRNGNNPEYLIKYGMNILDLVKNHEIFDSSVSAMFQELSIYLKPLEIQNVFSYNDISGLCDLIKRSIEFITTFPGDLIMGLRILRYLSIAPQEYRKPDYMELRYKYTVYDFYSHDGVATILSIIDKITTFFEQPAIHSSTFGSTQGVLAVHILLPAVEILYEMLAAVIKCRNTAYKDVTAIEPLLKTYNLMYFVPYNSLAYRDSRKIQSKVVKTLLAYTQPIPPEGVDTESVHKSLWTQMIAEVLKYIKTGPFTFITGLLAFSELLPLPLPILSNEKLSQSDINKLITERQLWSAHLHPQSSAITEVIQTICVSSYPQLLTILSRVCLNLADLAPNMTLLVSKSIVDVILNEQITFGATAQLGRLLNFISNLTLHPSIKVSVLCIIPGKFIEIITSILTSKATTEFQMQAEQNCNTLLQNLLDSEITLISPTSCGYNREMSLACALPSKEIVGTIINAVLENIMIDDKKTNQLLTSVETLILLTIHDFTIYQLRSILLDTNSDKFLNIINKILVANEKVLKSLEDLQLISSILHFIMSLFTILSETDGSSNLLTFRTIMFTPIQIKRLIQWKTEENCDTHILEHLKKIVEDANKNVDKMEIEDEDPDPIVDDSVKEMYELILKNINSILEYINAELPVEENSNTSSSDFASSSEPMLPQVEGIVTQFSLRQFYIDVPNADERLSYNYWIIPPSTRETDDQTKVEQIQCDLNELIRTCLPNETSITSECKRLLHLSASPQAARERTTTAPCYRARRVEVEPSTGRPEKKVFITPMRGRGFPRTPSRGDLFRSRPPNTSRPPSLHVDDFLALETCGAQPTGPTGYNKLSRDIINIRGGRSRGRGFNPDRGRIQIGGIPSGVGYRQRPWQTHMNNFNDSNLAPPPPQHYRTATSEPVVSSHFQGDNHYPQQSHFGGPSRGRIARGFGRGRSFNR